MPKAKDRVKDRNHFDVQMNSITLGSPGPLALSPTDLIGSGTRRDCYQYPGKDSLCIKIPRQNKHGLKQQAREEKFYRSLHKRGVSTAHITRYHGSIETSLGCGYIYDVIRDPDGNYAKSFRDIIRQGICSATDYVEVMDTLEDYLFDHQVLFYDLNPTNILCRHNADGSLEPFIIDGLGEKVAIPMAHYSSYLLERTIKRRWLRMVETMRRNHPWMEGYRYHH